MPNTQPFYLKIHFNIIIPTMPRPTRIEVREKNVKTFIKIQEGRQVF